MNPRNTRTDMPSAKDPITLPPPRSSAVWWGWSAVSILISAAVATAVITGIPKVEIVHRAALVWAGLQCIGIVWVISSKKPLSGKSTISQNVRLVIGGIPGLILIAFCGWWFPGIASMLLAFAAESDRDYWVAKAEAQDDADDAVARERGVCRVGMPPHPSPPAPARPGKQTPESESLVLQTLQNLGGDGPESSRVAIKWMDVSNTPVPGTTKAFTQQEWAELTKDDEVLQFTKRVNDAAIAKPYWAEDFRRALYDAFVEESGKRMCEKYSGGEGFSVIIDPPELTPAPAAHAQAPMTP